MSVSLVLQFLRFCIVGGLGFIVDAGVLLLLLDHTGLGPYLARLVSFLVAATMNWLLHRRFTFPHAPRDRRGRQWAQFIAANSVGGALNYGVYAVLIATSPWFAVAPVRAVAAASAVALGVNFAANRKWVFR